eukprot:6261337-Lingulodinium_polyedra.AAC.1
MARATLAPMHHQRERPRDENQHLVTGENLSSPPRPRCPTSPYRSCPRPPVCTPQCLCISLP